MATSGFSDKEISVLEKLIKREMGSIENLASIDTDIASQHKRSLKELLDKVKSNPSLMRDSDILACDEEIGFDEILLAKNGDPMARIRLPKSVR